MTISFVDPKGNKTKQADTVIHVDNGVVLSDQKARDTLVSLTQSRVRRGHVKKQRLTERANAKRIKTRRGKSKGKPLDGRGRAGGGTSGSAIASPLTETPGTRVETQRTVISDDGLFEVTVADATQITFTDDNEQQVIFNLEEITD